MGTTKSFRTPIAGPGLVGRQHLLDELTAGLDRSAGGRAYLLAGDPGIGKTAVLDALAAIACARGIPVLTTVGHEAETAMPFAGLVDLIRPQLDRVERLPPRQRDALLAALGRGEAGPSEHLLALSLLELASEIAADHGLLITVDDAHLLDPATLQALGFLSRRIGDEPVLLVATHRSNHPFPDAVLAVEHRVLGPLGERESAELLDRTPGLPPHRRDQLLGLAAGNPLTLLELPLGPGCVGTEAAPTGTLRDAIQRVFADRYGEFPAGARIIAATAASDGASTPAETLRAASVVAGHPLTLADLQPALDTKLLNLDGTRLRFRHPLVRAAIWQATAESDRRAIHRALAVVAAAEPDRRAVHLAAAAIGADDAIAAELTAAADRARSRGACAVALDLIEQAAHLTATPRLRVDRLLTATELAAEVGQLDRGSELISVLSGLDLSATQQAVLTWIGELRDDRLQLTADGIHRLLAEARACRERGELDLARRLVRSAAHRHWWNPHPDLVAPVLSVARSLGDHDDSPMMLFVRICVAPGGDADAVRAAVGRHPNRPDDPPAAQLRGLTAQFAGDPALAAAVFTGAEAGYRHHSQVSLLAQTLTSHAVASILAGQFRVAAEVADEAIRLGRDAASPRWQVAALLSAGAAAGCRGTPDPGDDWPVDLLAQLRNPAQWAMYAHVRGLRAQARGDHRDAFAFFRRVFDLSDHSHHQTYRTWIVAELADSGVRAGRVADVRVLLEPLRALPQPAPILRAGLGYAAALLDTHPDRPTGRGSDDPDPFAAALADPALPGLPFLHARIRLEQGSWLRRRHHRVAARDPLRQARDLFAEIGAAPWGDRARRELNACGEGSPEHAGSGLLLLTAQESAIARLAAQGHSNREIGARLFLSHRTVGSHLYRIFPKLGVTSRAQLAHVLVAVV